MGGIFWATDLQHCLLVLIIVQVSRGQVDERPLHAVLLRVVEAGMWPPHDYVAFDPSVGVRLPNMDVTFLGNDGATEEKTEVVQARPLLYSSSCSAHLTLISWTSGTSPVTQRPLSVVNLVSASCGESKLGL